MSVCMGVYVSMCECACDVILCVYMYVSVCECM